MKDDPKAGGGSSPENNDAVVTGVRRPLVPLVLALIAGLIAAAWGLEIPSPWLEVALVGLLAVLGLLRYGCRKDKSSTRAE
ncbi:MAG: hypothetical protein ACUVXF_08775 [Desulfobaccales bacterium]